MGTTVSLQQTSLRVDPGSSVSTEMRVRNNGSVVDQFSFQPLGDAAAWITVTPPAVRLFPDTDEVVTITIAPPRNSTSRAGVATWAVKAVPQEDPAGAAVTEGTVEVGTFVELGAELQPVTGRGRLTGRFELAVDNRGNVPVPIRINGTDPEQALGFEINPPQVDAEPGAAHFAKLRIKPADKIWRGQPKNHPFQVLVEPQARLAAPDAGGSGEALPAPMAPIVVNGNLLQEPVIPKWFLKALLALIALLIALFILWKTLLKPSVESAAREVAIEEVAPVSSAVAQLEPEVEEAAAQAEQATEQAAAAEEAAAEGAGAGGGGGGGGALSNLLNETSTPDNFRLSAQASVGASGVAAGAANDASTTFALTDVLLQNPGADRGRIKVLIGADVILESALESFLDLDFHFVAPYVVGPGEAISIEVVCAPDQIVPADPCDAAVSFSGFRTTITEQAPPTATTAPPAP